MEIDLVILIPYFVICCMLCYFVYAVFHYVSKITANFEIISDCFTEINKHIKRIELTQREQDICISSFFEKLETVAARIWK